MAQPALKCPKCGAKVERTLVCPPGEVPKVFLLCPKCEWSEEVPKQEEIS